MKTKRKDNKEKASKNTKFYTSFPFIALCILISASLLFFVWHQKSLEEASKQQDSFPENLTDEIAVPEQIGNSESLPQSTQDSTTADNQDTDNTSLVKTAEQKKSQNTLKSATKYQDDQVIPVPTKISQTQIDNQYSQSHPALSADKQSTSFQDYRCKQTTTSIKTFFQHLDKQQYLNNYEIEPNSETYFISLMQKILENPPVVSGETDDLYTILQNTAHFFRVIGNNNIAILKKILSNEKEQFEDVASKFYTLVTSPGCAAENFGLKVNKQSMYEYAGFFLNTMGGRLYLFRRDSISRMVISYYSILLIDRANIESFNKHGIELSTSIDLLISEMESTTNTLKLKETYLNTLYALQEQYQ